MKTGLIVLGHGARDPAWAQPFENIRARIARRLPEVEVELAFLDFIAPDLAAAGARLILHGCARIVVVPAFLGVGGHVRRDLPELVDRLRARHPGVEFRLAASIGEDAGVLDAIAAFCARRLNVDDRG